jgi:hypothetical protein
MAKLSKTTRAKLPKADFAGPKRSFPVEDKTHAREALAAAPRAVKAGTITSAQKDRIDDKANTVLHQGKKGHVKYT